MSKELTITNKLGDMYTVKLHGYVHYKNKKYRPRKYYDKDLSEFVKESISYLDMNTTELATLLGMSRSTLSLKINGHNPWKEKDLMYLSIHLK